jgi:hypothetical protein
MLRAKTKEDAMPLSVSDAVGQVIDGIVDAYDVNGPHVAPYDGMWSPDAKAADVIDCYLEDGDLAQEDRPEVERQVDAWIRREGWKFVRTYDQIEKGGGLTPNGACFNTDA